MNNKYLATYALISYGEQKVYTLGFDILENNDPFITATNMYLELQKRDLQYLWYTEWLNKLEIKDPKEFFSVVCSGGENLVDSPLGYDSTSCSVMFVCTMHYPSNMQVEIVDLTENKLKEPILCCSIDGKLKLPWTPYSDNRNNVDDINTFIHNLANKKYIHLQEESRFGEKDFKEETFKKYLSSVRAENSRLKDISDAQPDNTPYEIEGHTIIKNIPIDDVEVLKSLIKLEG